MGPVCLSLNIAKGAWQVEHKEKFDAFGWGLTQSGKISDNLQTISMKPYERQRCSQNLKQEISEMQICATNPEGDTCTGDSGGPLVADASTEENHHFYIQWGIVSYGDKNCSGVGVYVNVIKYANWIEKTIKPPSHATAVVPVPDNRWFLDDDCGTFNRSVFGADRLPYDVKIYGPNLIAKGTIIAKSKWSLWSVVLIIKYVPNLN